LDSDDDEDEPDFKKPATKQVAATKMAPQKKLMDSDSDEAPKPLAKPAPSTTKKAAGLFAGGSDDSDDSIKKPAPAKKEEPVR